VPASEQPPIPEDLRRFVLSAIPCVPFLEALLLLRGDTGHTWRAESVAARLYVRERAARALLDQLCQGGMAEQYPADGAPTWRYRPASAAMRELIDRLADLYARQLVQVTTLIHARLERKAQQFANAFTWRKEP
jgi:predicted ArsR family transcriptional regulator